MEDRNYLEGINWSELDRGPKLPHQMTPDEFRTHPFVVHHGTDHRNDMRAGELSPSYTRSSGMNLAYAGDRLQAVARTLPARKRPAPMHHYWAVPREQEIQKKFYDDDLMPQMMYRVQDNNEDAQQISSRNIEDAGMKFGYYHNAHEGRSEQFIRSHGTGIEVHGPLSVATETPSTEFIPHSKFVEHAIRNGLSHEVPNATMAEYVSGNLDTRKITLGERSRVERHATGFTQPHLDVASPEWDSEMVDYKPHSGGKAVRMTGSEARRVSQSDPLKYSPEDTEIGRDPQRIDLKKIEGLVHTGYSAHVRTFYGGIFR